MIQRFSACRCGSHASVRNIAAARAVSSARACVVGHVARRLSAKSGLCRSMPHGAFAVVAWLRSAAGTRGGSKSICLWEQTAAKPARRTWVLTGITEVCRGVAQTVYAGSSHCLLAQVAYTDRPSTGRDRPRLRLCGGACPHSRQRSLQSHCANGLRPLLRMP